MGDQTATTSAIANKGCGSRQEQYQLIHQKGVRVKKYSDDLLKEFQQKYLSKFGEEISLGDAACELNNLARLLEFLLPEPGEKGA